MPVVNRGSAPGDQNADTAYAAFGKVNDKFDAVDLVAGQQATAINSKADAAATATALSGKQPADPDLTALAALDATPGLVEQTGAAAFTKRAIGVAAGTSVLTRADGDARYLIAESGSIVQTVSVSSSTRDTTTTVIPADNTIPQITEGKEYLTLSITPKFSTSRIRLRAAMMVSSDTVGGGVIAALFADAVANALSAKMVFISAVGYLLDLTLVAEHTPGDTAAHTYRLRFGPNVGTQNAIMNGFSGGAAFGGASLVWFVAEEIRA